MGKLWKAHGKTAVIVMATWVVASVAPAIAHGVEHALFAHEAGSANKLQEQSIKQLFEPVGKVDLRTDAITSTPEEPIGGNTAEIRLRIQNTGTSIARNVFGAIAIEDGSQGEIVSASSSADGAACSKLGFCRLPHIGAGQKETIKITYSLSISCTNAPYPVVTEIESDPSFEISTANNDGESVLTCDDP
jgi:hypothetical protein